MKNGFENFIKKAIGCALRQHAKYDKEWVAEFVASYRWQPLSQKEALKNINY